MAKEVSLKKSHLNKIFKFLRLLNKKGIKVSQAILFGSYARGQANVDSDIDLAVVSSQFGTNSIKEMMFLRKMALKVDSHLEPLPFSPQDLDDRYSTLMQEIRRHGQKLNWKGL